MNTNDTTSSTTPAGGQCEFGAGLVSADWYGRWKLQADETIRLRAIADSLAQQLHDSICCANRLTEENYKDDKERAEKDEQVKRLYTALETIARVSNDPAIVSCAKHALTHNAKSAAAALIQLQRALPAARLLERRVRLDADGCNTDKRTADHGA